MSSASNQEHTKPASIELASTEERTRTLLIPVASTRIVQNDENYPAGGAGGPRKNGTPISIYSTFCRMLSFESFYIMATEIRNGPSIIEEKKIAILEGFSAAYHVSIFHAFPIMVSIALVSLNFKGFYIGGELTGPSGQDSLRILGLQVAAKLVELLIVASLSCIIFALLRDQLVQGKLPFGTITAGFEFSKLSFLWSKEFVATCRGTFVSVPVKALVISTIVVFTILSVGVGPAAAVSSQPALQNWPAGGTTFYLNSTLDELFPLVLDKAPKTQQMCSAAAKTSCFPSNYQLLAAELLSLWPVAQANSQFIPENTLISGHRTLRNLGVRFRGPFVYHPLLSSATVPVAAIADAVADTANYWTLANYDICHRRKGGFCNYNDIFFSVEALQPVTYVACLAGNIGPEHRFPNVQPLMQEWETILLENSTIGQQGWFDKATLNGTTTALEWIALPQTNVSRSSIAAMVAIPRSSTSTTPNQVLACSIDARWANATVTGTFWKGPRVVAGFPTDWSSVGREKMSDGNLTWPRIEISPAWAAHLNPVIDDKNTPAFSMLANSVGRASDITQALAVSNAVEAILGVMLADGLSRIASDAIIQGSRKEKWNEELLPKHVYGKGGSAFDYTFNPEDRFAKFQMLVTVNGYGYGFTVATLLSCLFLLLYITIASLFVAHTLYTRKSSSAWESIAEMMALAMNSKPTVGLRNTGAGIHSLGTLGESVCIGADGEHVELVFEKHDERIFEKGGLEGVGLTMLKKVEEGVFYE